MISNILSLLLLTNAALSVFGATADWMQIEYLRDVAAGRERIQDEAEEIDRRQRAIAIAKLSLLAAESVFFLIWIFRANQNAWALGAPGMRFTPGWCVGWFFVPVMSIYKPYQAVEEIWVASDPNPESSEVHKLMVESGFGGPAFLWLWWGLWIICGILGSFTFRMFLVAGDPRQLLTATWGQFALSILYVPLTLLTIFVVRGINERQRRRAQKGPDPLLSA